MRCPVEGQAGGQPHSPAHLGSSVELQVVLQVEQGKWAGVSLRGHPANWPTQITEPKDPSSSQGLSQMRKSPSMSKHSATSCQLCLCPVHSVPYWASWDKALQVATVLPWNHSTLLVGISMSVGPMPRGSSRSHTHTHPHAHTLSYTHTI